MATPKNHPPPQHAATPSDIPTPTVAVGDFSAAARWIWAEPAAPEAWWMFRRRFAIPGTPIRTATLKITSNLYHLAYVNGRLVQRGPGRSYNFAKAYSVIDITSHLNPGGDNVIAVLAVELQPGGVPTSPSQGVLVELDWVPADGDPQTVVSDHSWRFRQHRSFKTGLPQSCLIPSTDEWFDARLEEPGWTTPGYDDTDWRHARELGPVGTPPWTGMMRNETPPPSEDPVFPVGFTAIELARPRPGYRFRLGPASDGIMIYMTEVTAATAAAVTLWDMPRLALDGKPVTGNPLVLSAGSHLLTLCHLAYGANPPELFFETPAQLTFSAGALTGGGNAAWAYLGMPAKTVRYPWHESAGDVLDTVPEISTFLAVPDVATMAAGYAAALKPAIALETSTLYHAITRHYLTVAGGFTDLAIASGQPRGDSGNAGRRPLVDEQNLLHANGGVCTVPPQPGMDVHFIVDFDRLVIGYISMDLDAPAGTVVEVNCFEMINGQGIAWASTGNSFSYTCRDGRQRFLSHCRRGFRYAAVTLRQFSRPVHIHTVCCHHAACPIQRIGRFECSDPLLNQIYRLTADTAALCMLDTYVDCAGHEQNFWVGDARITAQINQLTYGAYALDQHHIRIVGQSLRPEWVREYWPDDERYTSGRCLPIAAFPNYPEGGLPMWTFLWMLQCWDHYWHGANPADLEENFGYLEETLRHCRLLTNERGLFELPGAWNLIEWSNNDLSPYGEVTANNVLLVQATRQTAKMAQALGRNEVAKRYEDEAQARQDAVNRHCWDETRQAYVDTVRDPWAYERYLAFCAAREMPPLTYEAYMSCTRVSVQSNTLALLSDCVPPERLEPVRAIVQRVGVSPYVAGAPSLRRCGMPTEKEAPDGVVAVGSPFFLFFSLGALFRNGNAQAALDIIRSVWGMMVESGTKGCWETFKGDEKNWTRSISHGWSTAPAVYLPTDVLGIKALAPGHRKFTVAPATGDLRWARGAVATPFGPIQVSWTRTAEDRLDITCLAPPQCERV